MPAASILKTDFESSSYSPTSGSQQSDIINSDLSYSHGKQMFLSFENAALSNHVQF